MTAGYRATEAGTVIDRKAAIRFTFNGKKYTGYQGDTLASALLSSGVHWVASSFKTHSPRGIMTADLTEPHALVQLEKGKSESQPNVLATEIDIYEGLRASSVNVWPSLKWDVTAINQLISKYLVSGFYYKTFMWPKSFWKLIYEPYIRHKAGLGTCEKNTGLLYSKRYDRKDKYCDLLIIGAGPAGLSAALEASNKKINIILADDQAMFGGSLVTASERLWVEEAIKTLSERSHVTCLKKTTVFGHYESDYLCARQQLDAGQRIWHIHAKRVIAATGAHERPLTFYGNGLPGVMLASAAKSYLIKYGVVPGRSIVLFTNNDSVYPLLEIFDSMGITIKAVIDSRDDVPKMADHIPIYKNTKIIEASGKTHISAVTLSSGEIISADALLVSGGWNPVVHLYSQSGGTLRYCDTRACFVPNHSKMDKITMAGSCDGVFDLIECLESGKKAALNKAFKPRFIPKTEALWQIPSGKANDTGKAHIVDFAEDVSLADIRLGIQEGLDSVELLKRYTTAGMGIDQGKLSNVNAIGLLAGMLNKPMEEIGTTTFRSPYKPITFAALAGPDKGDLLDPIRTTTVHEWHVNHGAKFENVGQWKRAWYYPKAGESMQDALNRECLAVHHAVGMLDASTLGKIDIQGKDAAQFLDLIYTNMFSTLKEGACRYGIMCHEDGMVFDDGVTARLSLHHYYMTTTTGGAANVLDWMEYWLQTQYPDLEVFLTSVTEQYGTVVISGPKARHVMQKLCPNHDFSHEAFAFMQIQSSHIDDIPVRFLRISFSGELSFEIHYPALSGPKIWDMVYAAGAEYGITPYGTETMHILRAEKGFIIIGQDTDGSVTPLDLNMQWVVSKKKDSLGKRSLEREDMQRPDRKTFVGLETINPESVLPEGAQLVKSHSRKTPIPMEGHVTSSYYSAVLGKSIALALIKNGHNRMGECLLAPTENGIIKARIVSPVFYDTKGERQHV